MDDEALHTPLPRGRHTLSAHRVHRIQCARARRACLDVVGELGYADTSIAQLVAAAGISRQTFYERYTGKLECFADAVSGWEAELLRAVEGAARGGAPRDGLRVALEALAADPRAARCLLLERDELPDLPSDERRRGAWDAIVMQATGLSDGFAVRFLGAAIVGIVREEVRERSAAALPRLEAPLARHAAAYVSALRAS